MPRGTHTAPPRRLCSEIVSWVREKALAETPVLALDALKAAVAEAGTAVIGFFDDLESVAAQGFRRGTACMEQVPAFISSDPQAFAEVSGSGSGARLGACLSAANALVVVRCAIPERGADQEVGNQA